jgi:hypothetical protein
MEESKAQKVNALKRMDRAIVELVEARELLASVEATGYVPPFVEGEDGREDIKEDPFSYLSK